MCQVLRVGLWVTVASVAAFSLIGGGAVLPDSAAAHRNCDDFWWHSGAAHTTDNVRWWHCHDWRTISGQDIARVHICGYSGTLHGVTVGHIHRSVLWDLWGTAEHAHDVGGEGC